MAGVRSRTFGCRSMQFHVRRTTIDFSSILDVYKLPTDSKSFMQFCMKASLCTTRCMKAVHAMN